MNEPMFTVGPDGRGKARRRFARTEWDEEARPADSGPGESAPADRPRRPLPQRIKAALTAFSG